MASAVENMQKLVWRVRYNAFHYLQMLKRLMPSGPIWRFPLFDCSNESLTPDWVYLDSWYFDDYTGGSFVPGPDQQWFGFAKIITAAGKKVAVSKNNAQEAYRYFNTGHPIKGDFELEVEMQLRQAGWDSGPGAITSLFVYDSGGLLGYVFWDDNISAIGAIFQGPPLSSDTVSYVWAANKSCKLKMKRVSGVFEFSYDIGGGWQLFTTTGTDSGDARIDVDLEDRTPGFSYVKFQADEGFPGLPTDYSVCNLWELVLSCFSTEMWRFEKRVVTLLTEMVSALSVELLPDWEELAGLPDECSSLAATYEERQNTVHEKITAQYTYMSKQFYIDYAAGLGVTITIETWTPLAASRCGVARCGVARCASLDTPFWWKVNLPTGDPMNDTIECLFNKLKPAETTLVFAYV